MRQHTHDSCKCYLRMITLLGVLMACYPAWAATPDRDWPSVAPTPAITMPMRDTAITRGTDGTYYLTGTPGVKEKSEVRSEY